MANNIMLLIIILVFIGIIVYFYYNQKKLSAFTLINTPKILNETNKAKHKKNRKKVRFDDNVTYYTYDKNYINKKSDNVKHSQIDMDKLFTSPQYSNELTNSDHDTYTDVRDDILSNDVRPANLDTILLQEENSETTWDSTFGLPLMTQNEKQKHIDKIHKNYKDYEKSLGKFVKYQTDDSMLINVNTNINPFDPNKADTIKGKTIKKIYDSYVEGPKAKPKQIKYQSDTSLIYKDESELNGGKLLGTKLSAFDKDGNDFKSANFSNEF